MKITPLIHCLRIDFQVTPTLHRFVHIFLLIGKRIYLIDAGVAGSEKAVSEYLETLGRSIEEIDSLFLTHSHPDHIGGAAAIKQASNCKVYASSVEKDWIQNIDIQFKDRPIPNFYTLLNESLIIDAFIHEGEVIDCEEGISIEVLDTPGHSLGSQCFLFREEQALFTGDAIPVPGDIPIYISSTLSEASLARLAQLENINLYLSAWDEVRDHQSGKNAILLALEKQKAIEIAVREAIRLEPEASEDVQFIQVCRLLKMEIWEQNPLFRKSVAVHLKEVKGS